MGRRLPQQVHHLDVGSRAEESMIILGVRLGKLHPFIKTENAEGTENTLWQKGSLGLT